jgi:hypothetical protein
MQRPADERYTRGASEPNVQSHATEGEEARHTSPGVARLDPGYLSHQRRFLVQGLAPTRGYQVPGNLQQDPSAVTAMMPPMNSAAMVGIHTGLPVMQGPSYRMGFHQTTNVAQVHGHLPSPPAMLQLPYGHMGQLAPGSYNPALAPYSSSQLAAQLQNTLDIAQPASIQGPSAVDMQTHPGSAPTMQHNLTESHQIQALLPRRPHVSGWSTGRARQSGSRSQAITNLRMCASKT